MRNMEKVIIKCKNCGFELGFPSPPFAEFPMVCSNCKSKMKIRLNGETAEVVEYEKKDIPTKKSENQQQPTKVISSQSSTNMGKLVVVRFHGLLGRKTYHLHAGSNTIGRCDANLPSDIEIKDDSYMSRRSVAIEVIQTEKGYLFKMNVLNASNPVYHNNKPLVVGESLYLNYGDSIKLGKTTFVFEKA